MTQETALLYSCYRHGKIWRTGFIAEIHLVGWDVWNPIEHILCGGGPTKHRNVSVISMSLVALTMMGMKEMLITHDRLSV